MNIPTEDEEAYLLVEYLQFKDLLFTHIANEGRMPIQYRMKLKKKGITPGVPDYMIIVRADQCLLNKAVLIFIELKRIKRSSTSPEQKMWIENLNLISDVEAVVIKGFDNARQYLEKLIR